MQSMAVERAAARLRALAAPEQMQKARVPALSGGINTNQSPSEIAANESPSIVNMFMFEGRLRSDTGYVPFGTGAVNGTPQGIFQVNHSAGNRDTILITTKTAYYLSTAGVWTGGSIQLSGEISTPVQAVSYAPFDWIVITNGIDPVFYFYLGQFQFMQFDLPTSVVARSLVVFHESLLLIGTTEGGAKHLRRVRASDAGNPTAMRTIIEGAITGIAAIYDLLDTDDDLHCAYTLGSWLILYRNSSIMRATYFGALNQILFWEYMITGEGSLWVGAVAPVTIAQTGAYHVLVGNYNIYRYRGDYSLEPVGDKVWQAILGPTGVLNPMATTTVWCQFIAQWHEVWIGLPTYESLVPDTVLRMSLDQQQVAWFTRRFAEPMLSAGAVLSKFEENVDTPPVLLAGSSGVFEYDFVSNADAGMPIKWSFETKDIGDGTAVSRFDRLLVRGRGAFDIGVEVSLDRGGTWQFLDVVNFRFNAVALLTFNLTSEYMRLRLSGTDPSFELTWLELQYGFESEWVPVFGVVS